MLFTSFCPRLYLQLLKEQATRKVIRDTITPIIRRGEIRWLVHQRQTHLPSILHSKQGCLLWGSLSRVRTASFSFCVVGPQTGAAFVFG